MAILGFIALVISMILVLSYFVFVALLIAIGVLIGLFAYLASQPFPYNIVFCTLYVFLILVLIIGSKK
ncbi:hypothetical protein [Campylobacter sp. VTCC 70190]|uniref:hypothetical protein n=1 Tax=Campylobacter sp. VTCC 70190 TaxID=3392118 RepID=UPI00398EBC5C